MIFAKNKLWVGSINKKIGDIENFVIMSDIKKINNIKYNWYSILNLIY